MCKMCEGGTMADQWAWIRDRILTTGWCLQAIEGGDERNPDFAYTIGLSRYDHPELIVFGMHPSCAQAAIEPVARAVTIGHSFEEDDDISFLYPAGWPPPALLRFPDSSTHLLWANDMYRGAGKPPIAALQLFWPSEIRLLGDAPLCGCG